MREAFTWLAYAIDPDWDMVTVPDPLVETHNLWCAIVRARKQPSGPARDPWTGD
jgi:hypothetical protein